MQGAVLPFSASEFREWISALYEHPEWRDELRRVVLTDELLSLPNAIRELVEAQRRTDQQISALAEAQRRTEERLEALAQRVDALAEAQRRTEARLDALAEAQRRTEERLEALAEAQRRTDERLNELKSSVDKLQQTFGATLEEEAADVLELVMRKKGYRPVTISASVALDGEVDVLQAFENEQGQRIWVIVETKARLSRRDVQAWVQRVQTPDWQRRLLERGVSGSFYLYFYAIRFDEGALEVIKTSGAGLLKINGEIIPASKLITLSAQSKAR